MPDGHGAGGGAPGPRDEVGHLLETGAGKARHADDLTAAYVQGEGVVPGQGESLHPGDDGRIRVGGDRADHAVHGRAEHQPRQRRLVEVGGRQSFADDQAVAQHRDPVADGKHLLEVVADHHHGGAGGHDAPDEGVEPGELVAGQGPRRLVQDHHALTGDGVAQRPGDGDAGPLGGGQVADEVTRGDRQLEPLEHGPGDLVLRLPVDARHEPAAHEPADADVLADREVVEQAEVLVDHRHPRRAGGLPLDGQRELLPVHGEAHPGVGRVVARQDLDQRGLPTPVLSDEGVDLARAHHEGGVPEHRGGAERLAHAVSFQASHGHDASAPQAVRKPCLNASSPNQSGVK